MIHIVHNLGDEYQGRIYLDGERDWTKYSYWTELPNYFTVDESLEVKIINPSRCALLCSDQWATVSKSYRNEILSNVSLREILRLKKEPFAFPNGVDDRKIKAQLKEHSSHSTEKEKILREYFGVTGSPEALSHTILFGFVGRICAQKGVMLILDIVEDVLQFTKFKAYFIIGGMIDGSQYSKTCKEYMNILSEKYPRNFWGNPDVFFVKGASLSRAADFF